MATLVETESGASAESDQADTTKVDLSTCCFW